MTNEQQKYSIAEFAMKSIGSIFPYGDTNIDEKRSENADNAIELLDALVDAMIDSAKLKDRCEWSISKIANKCNDTLIEKAKYILSVLDD